MNSDDNTVVLNTDTLKIPPAILRTPGLIRQLLASNLELQDLKHSVYKELHPYDKVVRFGTGASAGKSTFAFTLMQEAPSLVLTQSVRTAEELNKRLLTRRMHMDSLACNLRTLPRNKKVYRYIVVDDCTLVFGYRSDEYRFVSDWAPATQQFLMLG